jgi:hypothetical protein
LVGRGTSGVYYYSSSLVTSLRALFYLSMWSFSLYFVSLSVLHSLMSYVFVDWMS